LGLGCVNNENWQLMKVALVGPYPVDLNRIPGGVAAVTYYLAQGLAAQPDIDLHVICASKLVTKDRVSIVDNSNLHYLSCPKSRLIPNQVRDIGRIRQVLRQIAPDIVHSQTPSGAYAAAQAGLPAVLTIHGIPDQERRFAKGLADKIGATIAPWLTHRALGKADAGIAISQYVIDFYKEFSTLPWYRIHNPIENRFFEISGQEVPNKLLFAGVMDERKNIPGLIRAFHLVRARNERAELFICGKVLDSGIFTWAEHYLADHNLSDCVHLLGFVSQNELARHFAEAAIDRKSVV
jgi:glycosyltransferase involved in cell wall biosynthesis